MGKSGSNNSAPAPTPAIATPSVDVATAAATKALDAQGAANASKAATDEEDKKKPMGESPPQQAGLPPRPKKQMDAGTMMQAPVGGMNASAVLTG